MTTTPVLRYEHVACAYGRNAPVLSDVTFAVQAGEIVSLIGRYRTGKTALLDLAMGMRVPIHGSVRVFGMSPTERPVEVKGRVGSVPQRNTLPSRLTIGDVLGVHRRVFRRWDASLEQQLMELFGLPGKRTFIAFLSDGQKRQVMVICALAHLPELLLLDEPAPAGRREVLDASLQLHRREGTAIVFVSQYPSDVERLGGRVVVLDEGRVARDETVDELREQHTLARVSKRDIAQESDLARVTGCLDVLGLRDEWHAVFRGTPFVVRARLRAQLGIADARCSIAPLEEVLVGLVLGKRRLVAT